MIFSSVPSLDAVDCVGSINWNYYGLSTLYFDTDETFITLQAACDASLGWALTPQQVGPKRLSPKTPIKNLFLIGHWTGPAVGVASAVVSGLKTASMILKEGGVKEPLSDVGVIDAVVKG